MKTFFTLIAMLVLSVMQNYSLAQLPQKYKSFNGDSLNLYKWEGDKVMILSQTDTLNPETMKKWLKAMDDTYNYYYLCTDKEPIFYKDVTYFNNRSTIAEVPSTCGAGCAYLGWTGIELLSSYFQNMYNRIHNDNQFDQITFYEFGRNFWFYGEKLAYKGRDPITTGYAIFMRFMSMEYIGVDGAPFGRLLFSEFEGEIKGLLNDYMNSPDLNWENTVGTDYGIPNRWGGGDLFTAFCFYLKENYGGHEWVKRIWKEAGLRPNAQTTQDAVDNFIIASSIAANTNLTSLFKEWRWPISDKAMEELSTITSINPENISNLKNNNFYPNPATDIVYSKLPITNLKIYTIEGRQVNVGFSENSINLSNLPAGIYFIEAIMPDNNKINSRIVKK